MENYEKKVEELLAEMAKKEEQCNKLLLSSMYTIIITSLISLFITLLVTIFFVPKGPIQLIIILTSVVLFIIHCFIGLKMEASAGYYECKNCHHKFVPTYKVVLCSMHMGTTRHLKCPKCNKRTWSKKVLTK